MIDRCPRGGGHDYGTTKNTKNTKDALRRFVQSLVRQPTWRHRFAAFKLCLGRRRAYQREHRPLRVLRVLCGPISYASAARNWPVELGPRASGV